MAVFASISTLLHMNACTTEKRWQRRYVVSQEDFLELWMVYKNTRYFEEIGAEEKRRKDEE